MTPNSITICGLNCKVVHTTRIQTKYTFPPAKLRDEIAKRSGQAKHNYRSQYVLVERADLSGSFTVRMGRIGDKAQSQTYDITFAYEEALDDILSIIREIEADIAHEMERQRILALLDEED